jgi:tetratricopeptide (TPR) repeat protein
MVQSVDQGHWQPLTWLSFAVDRAVWGGMVSRGFHLTNLVLHGLAALLVLAVARSLLWAVRPPAGLAGERALSAGAFVAALLFAIHPMRVETVAWVTARRDLLAGVFYLAAVLVHVRGAFAGRRERPWLVAALMLASLMAQAWAVSLPAVLLVLEVWPLGRLRAASKTADAGTASRRAVGRVLLLFIPAIALLLLAAQTQQNASAVRLWTTHSLWHRMLQAGYGLCFYPLESVLPLRLSPIYPLGSQLDPTELRFGMGLAAALALTGVLLLQRRRHSAWIATWVAYALVVAPVLGFFQSGPQLVADRYSYLSCVPFALLLGAALRALVDREGEARPWLAGAGAWGAVVLAVAVLGPLTHAQAGRWSNDVTLWQQAVRSEPSSYFARYNLGQALRTRGRSADALPHLEVALRHLPQDRVGRAAIRGAAAAAYAEMGQVERGEALWRRVLAQDPQHVPTLVDLGVLAERLGRPDEAIAWWQQALTACSQPRPDSRALSEAEERACVRVRALLSAVGDSAAAAPGDEAR